MKKIIIIFACLIFFCSSTCFSAIEWKKISEGELRWDAVTTADGANIKIEYDVFLAQNIAEDIVKIATTKELKYKFKLYAEGRYYAGVRAVRKLSDGTNIESEIAWSNDQNSVKDGKIFGIQHYEKLLKPNGLNCLGF